MDYKSKISYAAGFREPHVLANYLYRLATEFHKYYNSDKIIQDDHNQMKTKLVVVIAVREVICDGMSLLGISTPSKM